MFGTVFVTGSASLWWRRCESAPRKKQLFVWSVVKIRTSPFSHFLSEMGENMPKRYAKLIQNGDKKAFKITFRVWRAFLADFGYILADFVDAIFADNFFEGSNDVRSG